MRNASTLSNHSSLTVKKLTKLDIIYACDLAVSRSAALRVASEAEAASKAGYEVGLLHLPDAGVGAIIAPEVSAVARLCGLTILDPEEEAITRLLCLHLQHDVDRALAQTSRIAADRTVVVSDRPVIHQGGTRKEAAAKMLSVVPATADISGPLSDTLKVERETWPVIARHPKKPSRGTGHNPLRIGFLGTHRSEGDLARIAARSTFENGNLILWTARGEAEFHVPSQFLCLEGERTSLEWFLRKIDALVIMDTQTDSPSMEALVASALAAAKPVVLPTRLQKRFGTAVLYGEPEDAVTLLHGLASDPKAAAALARRALAFAARQYSPERYVKRLLKIVGKPKRRKAEERTASAQRLPRVLFLPKGGVGLGHVARTLAVARHAGRAYAPVFVTLAESAGMIEGLGFRAEYLPSAAYANMSPDDWDPWFEADLTRLINAYDAEAIVFDGSDPSPALVRAAASREGCKLAWIRRGMWEQGYDPSLHLSPAFDCILEPGELAAERDRGATAHVRHQAEQVAPITLLDREELLPREAAAEALGLDPSRPAVLLQLGSGENRDIIGTLDNIITLLKDYDGLQIALAEWSNAPGSLRLWRGIKLLRGAPLSLYFKAFDFSVAAAGYNTFHEVVGYGLPTIFMPNTAPGMDDQRARAQFAQEKGAAIELPQTEIGELSSIIDLMMKDAFRDVMRTNCESLFAGNGARAASARIAELVN